MIYIESKDNSIFKGTRKLKERKNRTKENKYIIEGFRIVEEALKAGASLDSVFLNKQSEEKALNLLEKYSFSKRSFGLNDELFSEISDTTNSQGIIAVVNMEKEKTKDFKEFYILCDKVQDPGNLGTIIRTAHAAGCDGVILTKGTVDIYNEKVIRSTMGSIFYLPIIFDDDLNILKALKEDGFKILATSLEGKCDFFKEDLKGKVVVTVGNEGNGVSKEVYDLSDSKVKIPMPGNAESLNVAVATSIVLYERVRQKS